MLFLLPLLLATACDSDLTYLSPSCEVDVSSLSPVEGRPGDTVTIVGAPLTTDFDTVVSFGSATGTVLEVDRSSCVACDSCRSTQACTACDDCDNCDSICREECLEVVTAVVPELPEGRADVRLTNSHGSSSLLRFTILAPQDTGSSDTGSEDTGTGDTGASDTGSDDGGAGEGGGEGSSDTGSSEPPARSARARPTGTNVANRLGTCPSA